MQKNNGYAFYFHSLSGQNTEGHVVRYNACDELKWKKSLPVKNIYGMANSINDLYVFAELKEGLSIHGEAALLQMDSTGTIVKAIVFKHDIGFGVDDRDLKISPEGNLYVIVCPQDYSYDTWILKFNGDFDLIWSEKLKNYPIVGTIRSLATSDDGIIVQGTSGLIVKLDKEGNVQWSKRRYKSTSAYYYANPIEVENGYIFAENSLTTQIFKTDFNGNTEWVSQAFANSSWPTSMTYLEKKKRIIFYGRKINPNSPYFDSNSITELDQDGNIIGQVTMDHSSDWAIPTNISATWGDVFLMLGGEGDSTGLRRLFLKKAAALNDLLSCDYISFNDLQNSAPMEFREETVIAGESSVTVNFIDNLQTEPLNATDEVYCVTYKPIDLTVDLGQDQTKCYNEPTVLSSDEDHPYYLWSTGETTKSITVKEPGKYWLKTGFDCYNLTDTIEVFNFPLSAFKFDVTPRSGTPIDPVHFTSLSSPANSFLWHVDGQTFTDSAFSYYFKRNGRYPVIHSMTDLHGCTYFDTTYVDIRFVSFHLPNSFTPDNNGVNDVFKPEGFGLRSYDIIIYNRWGGLIFEGHNESWNGGKAMSDTYFYRVIVTDDFGEVHRKEGLVMLLR